MNRTFRSTDGPHEISSAANAPLIAPQIRVPDVGRFGRVRITVDIDHTWAADLTVTLITPEPQHVVLMRRVGGSTDLDERITFDDRADVPVQRAPAPIAGTYRPNQVLDATEHDSEGIWTLTVHDAAAQDGGALNWWEIEFLDPIAPPAPVTASGWPIKVTFAGNVASQAQRAAFRTAAERWERVLTGPDLPFNGVSGVVIDAQVTPIDGVGRIVGQAGPTRLRPRSLRSLPTHGVMQFDSADLARLERAGVMGDVIAHEMGHVLGFGTLWPLNRLVSGQGSPNPTYVGAQALAEWRRMLGFAELLPAENVGGQGTANAHWRESVFGNELMSSFLSHREQPLSRLTVAAMADLGYDVDIAAADEYRLPWDTRLLAIMGVGGDREPLWKCSHCVTPAGVEDDRSVA